MLLSEFGEASINSQNMEFPYFTTFLFKILFCSERAQQPAADVTSGVEGCAADFDGITESHAASVTTTAHRLARYAGENNETRVQTLVAIYL